MTSEETTIRELEIKLAAAERRFDESRETDAKALKLQAAEYERRLQALNNEHGRIAAAQSTYVSYSVLAAVISILVAIAAIYFRAG
jgi:hypothetical protein